MTCSIWTPEAVNSLYATPSSRTILRFTLSVLAMLRLLRCKRKNQRKLIPCSAATLTTKLNVC